MRIKILLITVLIIFITPCMIHSYPVFIQADASAQINDHVSFTLTSGSYSIDYILPTDEQFMVAILGVRSSDDVQLQIKNPSGVITQTQNENGAGGEELMTFTTDQTGTWTLIISLNAGSGGDFGIFLGEYNIMLEGDGFSGTLNGNDGYGINFVTPTTELDIFSSKEYGTVDLFIFRNGLLVAGGTLSPTYHWTMPTVATYYGLLLSATSDAVSYKVTSLCPLQNDIKLTHNPYTSIYSHKITTISGFMANFNSANETYLYFNDISQSFTVEIRKVSAIDTIIDTITIEQSPDIYYFTPDASEKYYILVYSTSELNDFTISFGSITTLELYDAVTESISTERDMYKFEIGIKTTYKISVDFDNKLTHANIKFWNSSGQFLQQINDFLGEAIVNIELSIGTYFVMIEYESIGRDYSISFDLESDLNYPARINLINNSYVSTRDLVVKSIFTPTNIQEVTMYFNGVLTQQDTDNINWSLDLTSQIEGFTHNITFTIIDLFDIYYMYQYYITTDWTNPVLNIISPNMAYTAYREITVVAEIKDENLRTIIALLNDAAMPNYEQVENTYSWNLLLPALEGNQSIYIEVLDEANNSAISSFEIILDLQSPKISFENMNTTQQYLFSENDLNIEINVDDVTIESIIADMNGRSASYSATLGKSVLDISSLVQNDGNYVLTIKVRDKLGRQTTGTLNIKLDTSAPSIELSPEEKSEIKNKVEFQILIEDKCDIKLVTFKINNEVASDITSSYNGRVFVKILNTLDYEDGEIIVVITATDELGHEKSSSFSFTVNNEGFISDLGNALKPLISVFGGFLTIYTFIKTMKKILRKIAGKETKDSNN